MEEHISNDFLLFIYLLSKKYLFWNWDDLWMYRYFEKENIYTIVRYFNLSKELNFVDNFVIKVWDDIIDTDIIEYLWDDLEYIFLTGKYKQYWFIEFEYESNNKIIKKYLKDKISSWKDGNMQNPQYINYYSSDVHIWKLIDYIFILKSNCVNDILNVNITDFENYDIIKSLIYLLIEEVVSLEVCLFEESNIIFSFKIINQEKFEILYKTYTLTNTKKIKFNNNNWEVYVNWELIWKINIGTQQYKFFKYLFDNKGVNKSHKEIKDYIYWENFKTLKLISNDLADIKRWLGSKIKNLVKANKWHYIIP